MAPDLMGSDNPLDALEPEMKDGPMGLPYVKPQGLPDLPDGGDVDVFDDSLPGR